MELFTFRITGCSPILMNNPLSMAGSSGTGMSAKKVYVPEEEAEIRTYRNEIKELVIPSMAFRAACLRAAGGRKIGKSTARAVLSGAMFPTEQWCRLIDKDSGKPITNYKLHSCRAVVNKKNGIIRVRPMIENWATDLVLEIDTEMVPNVEIITQILNLAGKIVGVMDWRPEKLGIYGRFIAELRQPNAAVNLRNGRKNAKVSV